MEFIKTGPHAGTLRLYKLRSPARYVDSFGDVITNQGKYVRVLEVVDTFLNSEFYRLETGYGQWWNAHLCTRHLMVGRGWRFRRWLRILVAAGIVLCSMSHVIRHWTSMRLGLVSIGFRRMK